MDEASFRLIAHGEKAGSCYTQNAQGWIFKKVRGAEVERLNIHCPPAVMRNKTICLLCCVTSALVLIVCFGRVTCVYMCARKCKTMLETLKRQLGVVIATSGERHLWPPPCASGLRGVSLGGDGCEAMFIVQSFVKRVCV